MKREYSITLSLFLLYVALLTWIILFKMSFSISGLSRIRSVNLIPYGACVFINGKLDFDEIFSNILAFVPIGVYVSVAAQNFCHNFLFFLSKFSGNISRF